ncbi:hypothetical protein FGO68_gene12202 [Halteria grandinella]|uniref:Uncharacterized protein n=1 Tax=Halteria grandinella TaxID=5974 RepID=A0A8J8NCP5_HALGN|nr:hypothetical protein FGO68_gene12202 [Halteria grandinella]
MQELKLNTMLTKDFIQKATDLVNGQEDPFPVNFVDKAINKGTLFGKPFSPTVISPNHKAPSILLTATDSYVRHSQREQVPLHQRIYSSHLCSPPGTSTSPHQRSTLTTPGNNPQALLNQLDSTLMTQYSALLTGRPRVNTGAPNTALGTNRRSQTAQPVEPTQRTQLAIHLLQDSVIKSGHQEIAVKEQQQSVFKQVGDSVQKRGGNYMSIPLQKITQMPGSVPVSMHRSISGGPKTPTTLQGQMVSHRLKTRMSGKIVISDENFQSRSLSFHNQMPSSASSVTGGNNRRVLQII